MPESLLIDLQTVVLTIALILPRTYVCFVILPGFQFRHLQGISRTAVAFAVALPAALPTFHALQTSSIDPVFLSILVFKEGMIGLIFGVVLSIPIWAAQSIGSIFDIQRAPFPIQPSATTDPDASDVGGLILQAAVLVMIQAGLYIACARIIIESYGAWPAVSMSPPFELGHTDLIIKRFSELFWHIIVYGAPVVICLMLIDFSFSMLGIFAPNLQISFASSPIKSVVGLFIVLVYWPTLSHYIAGDFSRMLDFAASFLQAGGGK